jgi:hypothetical protein
LGCAILQAVQHKTGRNIASEVRKEPTSAETGGAPVHRLPSDGSTGTLYGFSKALYNIRVRVPHSDKAPCKEGHMGEGIQSVRQKVNEYLIMEFGVDSDGGTRPATETWPFELTSAGRIAPGPGDPDVFIFQLEEPYYALNVVTLHCYPVAGMSMENLITQFSGAGWLATQEPIDLSTSATGLLGVPSIPERREAITSLVTSAYDTETSFRILEGLYLRKTIRYYALIELTESHKTAFIGTGITPFEIGFPMASSWRRLAYAVGLSIQQGHLPR